MNYFLVLKLIGNMIVAEAFFMLFPLGVAFVHNGQDKIAFAWSVVITATLGITLSRRFETKNKSYKAKDAFAAASLSWIAISFLGALPFYFSGYFASFIDCIFESVSGFTTTGSTILPEIQSLPKGILFWRNFEHWIGGMGVLLLMVAVMPSMDASSINLLRAESTGPAPGRIVPRIRSTARLTYIIYVGMTLLVMGLLLLAGLPVFDALLTAFSTAGTGGFSNMNASVGAYGNSAVEVIVAIFMFLFGISFSLYYYLFTGNFKQVLQNEELRIYFIVTAVCILLIAVDISGLYDSVWTSIMHSAFQVSTIITTTGFSAVDYNTWPMFSQIILGLLMIVGCCAGSTGGGLKLIRVLILVKAAHAEVNKILHPRSVKVMVLDGKKIDNEIVTKVTMAFFVYFILFVLSVLIISLENKDMVTTISAVTSSLSNVGPGFGGVGPTQNYSFFSPLSKLVLSFCMIAGRLEFFPIIVLFKFSIWKKAAM